jgi:hypothetical protein
MEEKTLIERIEIVLDPAQEVKGAFVNLLTGLWEEKAGRWKYPPATRQLGLEVAGEQGFSAKLGEILGKALSDALLRLGRAQAALAAKAAENEELAERLAAAERPGKAAGA